MSTTGAPPDLRLFDDGAVPRHEYERDRERWDRAIDRLETAIHGVQGGVDKAVGRMEGKLNGTLGILVVGPPGIIAVLIKHGGG